MKKFIILILAGLLLPVFVYGAVSYERTPSGYTITSPVHFNISFDDIADICTPTPDPELWKLEIWDWDVGTYESEFFAITTKSASFDMVLPATDYSFVLIRCYAPLGSWFDGYYFEQNPIEPWLIFEVVEEEPPVPPVAGKIFTIGKITDITDYIQNLFAGSGLYPLVALIIGLPLAFWGIRKIIDLKNEKEKKIKVGKLKELKTKKDDWL